MMLKPYNPNTEDNDNFVLQKLIHSAYDLIIFSKMVTTQVGVWV